LAKLIIDQEERVIQLEHNKENETSEQTNETENNGINEQMDGSKTEDQNEQTNKVENTNTTKQLYMTESNTINEQETPPETQPTRQPKRKKERHGFFGGMVGGFVSALLVVLLFTNNIFPFNNSSSETTTSEPVTQQEQSGPPIKAVSTDDNYDSESIDDISKAIVGVINVQQESIWTESEDAGSGSGIIYKVEDGKAYIVTNNHVVKDAENVEVDLNEDERVEAQVLGTDELTDLAVLEIDGDGIDHIADLGVSEDLHVGETVFAIGNPLGMEFSSSVTKGIISGLDRSLEVDTTGQNSQPDWVMEVIQTDAAINPGNSGGALVNGQGQVIGINSMKISQNSVEGIGFAIPIDSALPIMEQLETDGEIARPFIGIATVPIQGVPMQYRQNVILPDDYDGGMVIANVEDSSPADQAGLKQFDVITKINDAEITSMLDLRKYMYSETNIGDTIKIEYYRNGEQHTVDLKLSEESI